MSEVISVLHRLRKWRWAIFYTFCASVPCMQNREWGTSLHYRGAPCICTLKILRHLDATMIWEPHIINLYVSYLNSDNIYIHRGRAACTASFNRRLKFGVLFTFRSSTGIQGIQIRLINLPGKLLMKF